MGDVPSDWEDPGRVPPQVDPQSVKYTAKDKDMTGSSIYLPLYAAMKTGVLEEVNTYAPCFQNTVAQIYRHSDDTGVIPVGRATVIGAGVDEMVGSGRTIS